MANRRELARECGLSSSASRAEVLDALYRESGLGSSARVAGTAVWVLQDPHRRCLVAVRDRIGAEGLFYARIERGVLLSKSVGAILEALPAGPTPRLTALADHLCGDIPESQRTFWPEIFAVAPGHLLVATENGFEQRRYWSLEPQPKLRLPDDRAYGEATVEAITRVAKGYAPEGSAAISLSSGFDSTSVAAALVRGGRADRLAALVWIAPELPEADETSGALASAEALGLPVHELRADRHWPLQEPLVDLMRRDSPQCSLYEVHWHRAYDILRREGIGAVFTGAGGDELFGVNCYSYPDLLLTGRWLRLIKEFRQHAAWSPRGFFGLLRGMLWAPLRTWAYAPRRKSVVPWLREPFRGERLARVKPTERFPLLPGRVQRLRVLRKLDVAARLVEAGQRAAEWGVELLHPLLDHRLLEFAASLPTDRTYQAGERKIVLRNGFRGVLPDVVLDRRDKIYPTTIAWRGLRERGVPQALDLMTNMRSSDLGLVDEARLRKEYDDFCSGRHSEGGQFWNTLTLEAWLRRFP